MLSKLGDSPCVKISLINLIVYLLDYYRFKNSAKLMLCFVSLNKHYLLIIDSYTEV